MDKRRVACLEILVRGLQECESGVPRVAPVVAGGHLRVLASKRNCFETSKQRNWHARTTSDQLPPVSPDNARDAEDWVAL